jgi:adenosyl cobinamide kinase/adenosyl cobinamide phosphate guanylyltransferase
MSLTFLVGGARSGKSSLAVRLAAASHRPVTFVATAEGRDDEMAARIASHRAQRPPGWTTVDAPTGLGDAVAATDADACTVLDCLTVWVSNALEAGADDDAIVREASTIAATLAARATPSVVVSNEVGMGIVPVNALARRYRDVLGRVNAAVAAVADTSYLVVAGRALELETIV